MPDPRHDNSEPTATLVRYEDLEQATGFTQISNAVSALLPPNSLMARR